MADQQTPQDLAFGMLPGGAFVNWLSQTGQHLNNAMNSHPDPAVQARQAEQMRRARIGYALNQQRQSNGLPPLTDHHLDAAIDEQLHAYAMQMNRNRNMMGQQNALRLNTQPAE